MSQSTTIGIIDIQIYFPSLYISQSDLERYDNVSQGKYTIGLGQENLSFANDNEDINSICLSVLYQLLNKNSIHLSQICRIEVGSETFVDKSKSIKTYLMDLFKDVHNVDIEGVTVSNACYGGTAALLNTFNYMNSIYYDKNKYAIVICGDIAIYSKGPARPTGGCGAIGMLIGPGGSIVLEHVRASCMKNVFDFYKPNPISEYPIVDGKLSLDCYLEALWECIWGYINKGGVLFRDNNINNDNIYYAFHCPYSKLVEKAFSELKCVEMMMLNDCNISKDIKDKIINVKGKYWKLDKDVQSKINAYVKHEFNKKIIPGLFLCKQLGNLYTGSLYGFILSLLLNDENLNLYNKRIICFSYGSGYASTLFSLKIVNTSYQNIILRNKDIFTRLQSRYKKTPLEYETILSHKEKQYLKNNYIPISNPSELYFNTFYLSKVDDKWRRFYLQKTQNNQHTTLIRNTISNNFNNNNHHSSIWSGFHKKSILERQLQIKKLHPDVNLENLNEGGLSLLRADNMIENCIGVLSIPIGLGLNFKINGKEYSVPMATEEPSVIAAASAAAKLISDNDGFFCYNDPPYMISQIHYEIENECLYDTIKENIIKQKENIITYANVNICPKMVQRGGGVTDVFCRKLNMCFYVVEFIVNVCDSMGANLLNQISEEMSKYLINNNIIINSKPILRVLSNLSVYRKTTSEFKINVNKLTYKSIPGNEIADLIIKSLSIAKLDPFRASTHNKGIMNGIDAVALALGQDFRAIEAAIHSYASLNPKTFEYDEYKPLTYYEIVSIKGEKYLYGNLTIPLAIGTVGGAINSNELYKNMMNILHKPNSTILSHIITSVGLAQNFAALRALVSEGIQKGHISLHAKNIAFRAGVPDYLIPDVVSFMKNNNSITEDTAMKYLESVKLYRTLRQNNLNDNNNDNNKSLSKHKERLSTFYINIDFAFLKYPICMNFLIKTKIIPEINFVLNSKKVNIEDKRNDIIFQDLFGKGKQMEWLYEFMLFVHEMDLFGLKLNEIFQIKYKVKLIIILMFILTGNLLKLNYDIVSTFVLKLIENKNNNANKYNELSQMIPNNNIITISMEFGMTVLLELYEICHFYLNNYIVVNKFIKDRIKTEINKSLTNFVLINKFIHVNSGRFTFEKFLEFFELRITRLNAEVLLLCDLAFNDEQYNEIDVEKYVLIGRYAEIKITLLRDYAKAKENGKKYLNSYLVYKEVMERKGVVDDNLIKNKYMKVKEEELNEIKNKIGKYQGFKEKGMMLINKIEKRFEVYYKGKNTNAKL